ncbi:MAG: hypothetical protein ABJA74_17405, partial [Lapillicoccus sp.]
MGALGRGQVPGSAGVMEGQVVGAAVFRVVGQPRVVHVAAPHQLVEDGVVSGHSAVRRHGLVDRLPGDVVPEPQAGPLSEDESGAHQLVEVLRRHVRGGAQQVRLHPRPDQRGHVERRPRRAADRG